MNITAVLSDKRVAMSGISGPQLQLEVVNLGQWDGEEVALQYYFGQRFPTDVTEDYRACPSGVVFPLDSTTFVITIPPTRVDNTIHFQLWVYQDAEPTDGKQRAHHVAMREACGSVDLGKLVTKPLPTVDVGLWHISNDLVDMSGTPTVTLKLKVVGIAWPSHPLSKSLEADDQHGLAVTEVLRGELDKKAESVVTIEDSKRIDQYAHDVRTWLKTLKDTETKLSPWDTVCSRFSSGELPQWAFLREYAFTTVAQANRSTPSLERLCYVSLLLGGLDLSDMLGTAAAKGATKSALPSSSASSTLKYAEALGDMLTLLPLSMAYVTDREVTKTAGADGESSCSYTYSNKDQWIHLLASPDLNQAYDCEDGAAVVYYLFHLLIRSTAPSRLSAFNRIRALAQRYTCFVAICSLQIGDSEFTYHAVPVLVDTALVKRRFDKKGSSAVREPLPTLVTETTEATCCVPHSHQAWSESSYNVCRVADPNFHCKIPGPMMDTSHQYRNCVKLLCPQLQEEYGVSSVYCCTPDGKLGVPMDTLRARFDDHKAWKAADPVPITPELLASVDKAIVRLPRTPDLPAPPRQCNTVPFVDASKGQVLLFTNSSYGKRYNDDIRKHFTSTRKAVHYYEKIPVLNGVDLSLFVVTPRQGARTRVGTHLTLRGQERKHHHEWRSRQIGSYSVRGLHRYHNVSGRMCKSRWHHHESGHK